MVLNLFKKKHANHQAEKARLEAFLDAFPGEYCGLSEGDQVTYSQGFCSLLGLERVSDFDDIQGCLMPGDSAALEGLYGRLLKHGTNFTLDAETLSHTKIKITGSLGRDAQLTEKTTVLWIEKQSEEPPEKEEKDSSIQSDFSNTAVDELHQVQAALNSIIRPLWLRDTDQRIVWCNSTYAENLSLSIDEVIDQQKEISSPPSRSKSKGKDAKSPGPQLAKEAIEVGQAMEAKAHGVFQGKRILMKISETPLMPLGMTLGIAFNITREEELEQQLQRYQSSNEELMEQLQSAICIFNSEQKLEFYNSSFSQLWGLKAGWLNSKPTLGEIMEKLREDRHLPEQSDFRRFKKSWLDMFTSLIDPHEDMLFLPDGSTYRMLVVPHSQGGLMMNFEDVTSRLELESSYNTLIAVQRETLDNLVEGVAVYGGDGRLKLWNPAFAKMWNFNPEDLSGEPHINKTSEKLKKFFEEEEWAEQRKKIRALALERYTNDGRMRRKDGVLLEYVTVPLPDGGVLITFSNVTDTVRIEYALREKNAALEAAERLKMDFLANVSYQLRTPLNAIMGFTEILNQEYFGPLNERQKEYTYDMKDASQRLVSLINDILDLSTLEAGYMNMQREDVKVYDLVQSIEGLMQDWARKEKVKLEVKCAKNIGTLNADEKRIKQVLVNLIRNSITFTPAGGEILLHASRKKEGVEISIHDNGIGITAEDRSRIFEPFERAQSGAANAKLTRSGAGLGLSLVKNIVTLHGGTVDLESEPGEGTKVTLFIPFLSIKTSLKLPIKTAKS